MLDLRKLRKHRAAQGEISVTGLLVTVPFSRATGKPRRKRSTA